MGNTLSTPGGITTTAPLTIITETGSTLSTPHETTTTTHLSTIEKLMRQLLTPPTSITGQGFFRLPPEMRNVIYEYVLADVQDNVCIDLGAGLNKVYRVEAQKNEQVRSDNKASYLGMLLACKQINREASRMAYSKMSMSLETVSLNMEYGDSITRDKESDRLKAMLINFAKAFDASKSSLVTNLVLHGSRVLPYFGRTNWRMLGGTRLTKRCTAKCEEFEEYQGMIHETFHNIRYTTLDVTNDDEER